MNVDVMVAIPKDSGWEPIRNMTFLLSKYLDTKPIFLNVNKSLSSTTKILSMMPRMRKSRRKLVLIAYDPGQLYAISQLGNIFSSYGEIYGWVIDSFWSERIPRIAQKNFVFDKIFVTDPSDIPDWHHAGVKEVGASAWGTDVWTNIGNRIYSHKSNDVLRVGRQPIAWEDDSLTLKESERFGIKFEGRPKFGETTQETFQNLSSALQRSKIVLAFSNKVSPTSYTHPTKEYLTGRWVDALGWGCVVAGQVPKTAGARELLWEEATIEVSPFDLHQGVIELSAYLATNRVAPEFQVIKSLEKLDWRWRFKDLFDEIGIFSPSLVEDLMEIENYIKEFNRNK